MQGKKYTHCKRSDCAYYNPYSPVRGRYEYHNFCDYLLITGKSKIKQYPNYPDMTTPSECPCYLKRSAEPEHASDFDMDLARQLCLEGIEVTAINQMMGFRNPDTLPDWAEKRRKWLGEEVIQDV